MVSRLGIQQSATVTHNLESQEQASSGLNITRYSSHSQPEEPKTVMFSRLEILQGTTATHSLKSEGPASSEA